MAASGKVIGEKKPKSLWERICEEFAAQRAEFEEQDFDDSTSSVDTEVTQFSASRHHPVLYGKMVHKPQVDTNCMSEFDPAVSHPAAAGLCLLDRPAPKPEPTPPPLPNPQSCSPREYLETYVFPTLIPAMMEMLKSAKEEHCFERKRTKFNACDFLTEYLYKKNPIFQSSRSHFTMWEIPFVKSHLIDHPRPPLPLSLLWSEEEATVKIQSFWRGHLVRVRPDVQELRQWQREWREENADVRLQVQEFWEEKENKEQSNDTASSHGHKSSEKSHENKR